MGIDAAGAQFLLAARASGVDFSKTATLGRQTFFPTLWGLKPIAKAFRLQGGASRVLSDCEKSGDRFFELLGATRVDSVDACDHESASVIHDMNLPIPEQHHGAYTAFFDGGTLEHIFNVPQALHNCLVMVKPGGHFLSVTTANNCLGHGFYQFSPEFFFRTLTPDIGFVVDSVMLAPAHRDPPIFYAVQDPQEMGRRVELVNSRPVHIFTIAHRCRDTPIPNINAQQSDYEALWEKSRRAAVASPKATLKRKLKWRAKRFVEKLPIPSSLACTVLRFQSMRRLRAVSFRQSCYRRLTVQQMACGQISSSRAMPESRKALSAPALSERARTST
jgi:hypothetical protein